MSTDSDKTSTTTSVADTTTTDSSTSPSLKKDEVGGSPDDTNNNNSSESTNDVKEPVDSAAMDTEKLEQENTSDKDKNDDDKDTKVKSLNQELADEVDDLFGDDDEDEDMEDHNNDDNDNEDNENNGRRRYSMDEEEEMYNRKFYGDDANMSDMDNTDDHDHDFKEQDVELVRRVIPYNKTNNTSNSNDKDEQTDSKDKSEIYYAKIPAFLTIDPIPFDPASFEEKVKERLNYIKNKDEQIDDGLIDEHTVRWRYSRDSNQKVFKESNTQIVQWSDGSFSLKLGDEYTDILVNDTDNTFLAVAHEHQELMQCVEGGEIKKTMMFIPTSTNSKIHQRLSKAVTRRNSRTTNGPGTYIINVDPEIEKKELEKRQTQIFRERRRRQLKERELQEDSENGSGGSPMGFSNSYGNKAQKRSRSSNKELSDEPREYSRRFRGEDEYEDDGFLVDDDEEEEYNDDADDLLESGGDEEPEEEEEVDEEEEERQERARAERLAQSKKSNDSYYQKDETPDSKRRKVALISDDESD